MSLIRPEIRAAAWRGREMLTGLGLALLGAWASVGSFGLLRWLGIVVVLASLAFAYTGWQRMRLRPRATGQGVIEVDEGRITFWGPLDGGSVGRDALRSVSLDHGNHPATWVLRETDGTTLHIPVNAGGQDALLDALDTLPGLSSGAVLAALQAQSEQHHLVWSRSPSVDTAPQTPHL